MRHIQHLFLLSLSFLLLQQAAFAQAPPDGDEWYYWKVLGKVKYKSNFDKETGEVIYEPFFVKAIEELEGKEIVLKGYIIPADLSGGRMTLSAFPYSSCFFCGGAGPESVAELDASEPIIYRMDKAITIIGKLKLNGDDPFRLMYILEDARYYSGD